MKDQNSLQPSHGSDEVDSTTTQEIRVPVLPGHEVKPGLPPASLSAEEILIRDLGPDAPTLSDNAQTQRRELISSAPVGLALTVAPDTTLVPTHRAASPDEFAKQHPEVTAALLPPVPSPPEPRSPREAMQDIGQGAAAAARRMLAKPGEAVQAAKDMPGRVARLGSALRENTAALIKEGGPLTPAARKIATVATAATLLLGVGGGVAQFGFEGKPAPKEAVAAMPNPGANHALAPLSPGQAVEQPPELQPKQGAPIEEDAPTHRVPPHQALPEPTKKHEEKTPKKEESPHKPSPNGDTTSPKPHPGNDKPPTPQPPATEKPPQTPEEPAQPPTTEPPVEQPPAQPSTGQNTDGTVNPQLQQRTM